MTNQVSVCLFVDWFSSMDSDCYDVYLKIETILGLTTGSCERVSKPYFVDLMLLCFFEGDSGLCLLCIIQ